MKRFIICICSLCLFLSPMFAIQTTDNFELSAYKTSSMSGLWVKIQAQNLSGEILGPGRNLDLDDGSQWVGSFVDAFSFTLTGNNMRRVDVTFEFTDFMATDSSGGRITGDVRFKSSGFGSDYGTYWSGSWPMYDNWIYSYREEWPLGGTYSGAQPLNGASLAVAGRITRRLTSDDPDTNKYSIPNPPDAKKQYTRTGVIQLRLNQNSYDAAPAGTTFVSTVRINCMVDY